MVRLSAADKVRLYRDILVKADMALKRYDLPMLSKEDLANEVWLLFIKKHKLRKYDASKGASVMTFSCIVCGNLLKDYLRMGIKGGRGRCCWPRDDFKREISSTMDAETNPYFYNMAKEYQAEPTDAEPCD